MKTESSRKLRQRAEEKLLQSEALASEALRESEEKYRVLVECANEIIVVIQDGMICMVNPAAIRVTGYSEEELTTTPFPAFVHPVDRDTVVEKHWARLSGEVSDGQYEFRFIKKDASVIWVINSASIINWGGRPATLSIFTIITKQKNLMDSLRESEAQFRLLAENANDNIWTMTLDGRLTFVSQSIYKIRGFTSAEALAQSMEEVIAPDSLASAFEALGQISTNVRLGLPIENVRMELELLCKGGSTVWTEVNINGMYGSGGAFVQLVGVTRDITERKQAETELRALLDKLDKSHAAERNARIEQGRFIAMFSHEYRTPLSIIRGNLDLIELKESKKTGDYVAELSKMKRAVNRLVELMDNSLAKSRITDYQVKGELQAIQAAAFMDSLLEYTRTLHTEYEFIHVKELDASITFNGEAEYLKTALVNLLDNAVKYSIANTPITITCRVESYELVISIHNHGFGLTPVEEEWFFEKYRRGRGSSNTSGAGLGLWLVRDIITQHGGSITLKGVKSEVTATVRLPLAWGIDNNYEI